MEAIIVHSLTMPSRQTEQQKEKKEGEIVREGGADRKEQWDRRIKDKSLP